MIRRLFTCLVLAAAIAGVMAAVATNGAHAQIPQTFKNLKVFPRDIPRQELVLQMRQMAGALGVRCGYCHAGGNPETLEGVDFASDSFETKRVARVMLRMTREINSSLLPLTGRDTTRLARVSCVTCHHGMRRPETLADTLLRALKSGGTDSAAASYRTLRDRYYGRAAYDFGEGALQWIAEQGARLPGHADAAIPLLELNLEFFPKSVNTRTALGDRFLAKGDTTAAIKQWEQALAIEPGNDWVRGKIEAARGRASTSKR